MDQYQHRGNRTVLRFGITPNWQTPQQWVEVGNVVVLLGLHTREPAT